MSVGERDQFVVDACKWSSRVARRILRRSALVGLEFDEMVATGNLAAVVAVDEYLSRRPAVAFAAYVCWRMKHAIYDWIRCGGTTGMRVLRYRGEVKQIFEVESLDSDDAHTVRARCRYEPTFVLDMERRDQARKLLHRSSDRRGALILWHTIGRERTVSESAKRLGISQARASQLRAEALSDIRLSDGVRA